MVSPSTEVKGPSVKVMFDTDFKGHRGRYRIVVMVKLFCGLIAMLLAFSTLAYWPNSLPATADELLPVVQEYALETFAVSYSYTMPGSSGLANTWNVESTTTVSFMATATTSLVTHPDAGMPTTLQGTWYRGDKPPGFLQSPLDSSHPCGVGKSYNATEGNCPDFVDPCINAGSTTMRYMIGSCLIYATIWLAIFSEITDGKPGDSLRLWRFLYLIVTLIAFILTLSAESSFKRDCGDLMEQTFLDYIIMLNANRGEMVRVNGRGLDVMVASAVFGIIFFVIGFVEFIIYHREGKRLGEGDPYWRGEPSPDADTGLARRAPTASVPVNSRAAASLKQSSILEHSL